MIQLLKKLLGMGEGVNYKELVQNGAIILDVRTKDEYRTGHIAGSVNIPVQSLPADSLQGFKKEKPIITCCASGMRSASARSILIAKGFKEVYNGGGWTSLQSKLN